LIYLTQSEWRWIFLKKWTGGVHNRTGCGRQRAAGGRGSEADDTEYAEQDGETKKRASNSRAQEKES